MAEEDLQEIEPKKSKGKLFGILFVVLNLSFMGGGTFFVYQNTLGYVSPTTTEEDLNKEFEEFKKTIQGDPVLFSMDTIKANLDGIPRRMIRMELSLEMLDDEGFEEVIGVEAEARDTIMRILASKKFFDIETVQGKLKLKNEIIVGVNKFLDKGVVRNVFYTDFLVQ